MQVVAKCHLVSSTYTQAIKLHVLDNIAPNEISLLADLDPSTFETPIVSIDWMNTFRLVIPLPCRPRLPASLTFSHPHSSRTSCAKYFWDSTDTPSLTIGWDCQTLPHKYPSIQLLWRLHMWVTFRLCSLLKLIQFISEAVFGARRAKDRSKRVAFNQKEYKPLYRGFITFLERVPLNPRLWHCYQGLEASWLLKANGK